jgi:hypothetical protein
MTDAEANRLNDAPEVIRDFADQAVRSVRNSVGILLDFGSDTLPLLDHYLREVPKGADDSLDETAALVASMAGAYFGEVVRARLGGSWRLDDDDPGTWRLTLPGGLSFLPARLAMAAIVLSEDGEGDPEFSVPAKILPHLEAALERMAPMSTTEYYALSTRYDTLEHLQEVLLAVAAELAKEQQDLPN